MSLTKEQKRELALLCDSYAKMYFLVEHNKMYGDKGGTLLNDSKIEEEHLQELIKFFKDNEGK